MTQARNVRNVRNVRNAYIPNVLNVHHVAKGRTLIGYRQEYDYVFKNPLSLP